MREKLLFAPNIPQTIKLMFPEPRQLENGNFMFTLEDQRVMFLHPEVAQKIQALGVKPGELFSICKRWNGQRGRASVTRWDVWLRPEAEQSRAREESEADLTCALQRSIDAVRSSRGSVVSMPTPALPLAPTGTDGPAPVPVTASVPRKPPEMGKIPFNVAFMEAVKLVKAGLEGNSEQWNDEARQGMVSTILIAAANQGWLTVWERDAA